MGIRSGFKRLFRGTRERSARPGELGASSRFVEGQWVRVVAEDVLRERVDDRGRLRGLEWGKQQAYTCGRAFQVSKVVRRIIDDGGRLRAVSGTVLLDDVTCGGEHEEVGCGRLCPMMYRDEWLEPIDDPGAVAQASSAGHVDPEREARRRGGPDAPRHATVRSVAEIERTLDILGRRGSLLFMPEMARWAGQRFPIHRRVDRVWEFEIWVDVPEPVYILEDLRCTGDVLGQDAPCDRRCHVLWHRDWLDLG